MKYKAVVTNLYKGERFATWKGGLNLTNSALCCQGIFISVKLIDRIAAIPVLKY